MNNRKIAQLLISTFVALFAIANTGCNNGGGSDGQAQVSMNFASYTASNPILEFFVPSAWASPNEVKLCFKRLRFKLNQESTAADPSADEDNVDFNLGEVSLSAAGTSLGDVTIPEGEYQRIEFDLEDSCGYSLYVDNVAGGIMQTNDRITIKFEGIFDAVDGSNTLSMSIQDILNGLDTVSNAANLKTAAEAISGDIL